MSSSNKEKLFLAPMFDNGVYGNPIKDWSLPQFGQILKWKLFGERAPPMPSKEEFDKQLPVTELDLTKLAQKPHGNAVRATWIGHATYLIQTSQVNFLTDPIWSERCSPSQWVGPKRLRQTPVGLEDLHAQLPIDFVLVSHDHYDHLDWLAVKTLKNSTLWIVPEGLGKWFLSNGVSNVHELTWGQSVFPLPSIRVTSTPAMHYSTRFLFRNRTLWCSFVVEFWALKRNLDRHPHVEFDRISPASFFRQDNIQTIPEVVFPTPGQVTQDHLESQEWKSALFENVQWVDSLTPSLYHLYVRGKGTDQDCCTCSLCAKFAPKPEKRGEEKKKKQCKECHKKHNTTSEESGRSGPDCTTTEASDCSSSDCGEVLESSSAVVLANDDVRRIFFCGDSGYSQPVFAPIGDTFGAIDLALIPIGAYRPEYIMEHQHMAPAGAVRTHLDIRAKHSLAMHWGTFSMTTTEPVLAPPLELRLAATAAGLAEDDFQAVGIGTSVEFSG
eukprot:GCRY01002195.1.p1 GENE.GCRY01002195.1~~GCRY01002195.1.p1  ORF type:complete len:498 (+),score=84.85 GCRY01002195.1:139-1632(+)